MSTWGVWGYWGIVVGLAALVMIFFVAEEILSRAPKSEGLKDASAAQREPAPASTRRAA